MIQNSKISKTDQTSWSFFLWKFVVLSKVKKTSASFGKTKQKEELKTRNKNESVSFTFVFSHL
jgi:hypothetical protein